MKKTKLTGVFDCNINLKGIEDTITGEVIMLLM